MAEPPKDHAGAAAPSAARPTRHRGHPSHATPHAHGVHAPGSDESPTSAPGPVTSVVLETPSAQEHYLRALADVENTKKRLTRERDEWTRYATEAMVRALLPILDSLDHALRAAEQQPDPTTMATGLRLIHQQLMGLLAKERVERMTTVGTRFDPHQHEAIAHIETDDGTPGDTILEELQVGYTMHGKVIRPAMVKVAKHPVDHPQ